MEYVRTGLLTGGLFHIISTIGDRICVTKLLAVFLSKDLYYFAPLPQVELPFYALAVRIESGMEASISAAHFTQRPIQGLYCDLLIDWFSGNPVRFRICARQKRVVVEHLLKVWN